MTPAIIALDTETTGLNPDTDQILSVALILLDDTFNELARKVIYAFPDIPVNPKAAEINGYSIEEWTDRGAVSQIVLFAEVHEFMRHCRNVFPMGHNVEFDMGFMRSLYKTHASPDFGKHFSYHSIDTVGISVFADMVLFGRKSSTYKLSALCERFGVQLTNAHDALADVEAMVSLFRYLYTSLGGVEKRAAVPPPVIFSRMLIKKNGIWTVNGGKHKGKALTTVAADTPDYLQWMLGKIDDLSDEQKEVIKSALQGDLTREAVDTESQDQKATSC